MRTESYIVRYQIQNEEGYWVPKEKRYYMNEKGQHKLVEKRFLTEFRKYNVKIISILYE